MRTRALTYPPAPRYPNVMQPTGIADDVCQSPVFVLSPARSGSTLLRFILDSHPELACPPETDFSLACKYLANTWRVLEDARADVSDSPPNSEHVLAAIRNAIDSAFGRYLQSTGKSRWCDKSPDSCWEANLLARLYPEGKFLCLYRHSMDVIASAVEQRPWGLGQRVGLESDSFVAQYPGNSVAACGAYWVAHVRRMLTFEQDHPELCHRIRYEDLVTAPEETTARMFSFLGVADAPGITEACFQIPHPGNGPGDKKILFTSNVSTNSIGRGVQVPQFLLPEQLRIEINQALAELDYRIVDKEWNETVGRIDPRVHREADSAVADSPRHAESDATLVAISGSVESRSDDELRLIMERWPFLAGQAVEIIVQGGDAEHQSLSWYFAPADAATAPRLTQANGQHADENAKPIRLAAGPATWRALLEGTVNVDSELKAGRLRTLGTLATRATRWDQLLAVAALLGISQ
jgi:protein-tyrosine sulfotransferase